ncbi:EAL domain-containing protein [Cognaticolwellia mytili]|uniref:EAL domain-containing protein n=1 Tax=Cognaticolwellia mytili TaxID=1888913 RepID=UPI001302098B|nr:EAL domain-containing protein [Cognaticolwellia mytili]
MALPFIVITLLGANQISQHYQAYVQSKQGSQFVAMSLKLEALMVELQKERGLTEFYITAPSNLFKEKVHSQRNITDQAIKAFDSINGNIDKQQYIRNHLTDNRIVQLKLNKLAKLIEQLYLIRLNIDKNDEINSFNFYSSLITKAIDIIENIEVAQSNPIQSRLTSEFINLLWLIERSGQERGALNGILASKSLDVKELQYVLNYIAAQDEIVERFLSTATSEKQKLLKRILASKEHEDIVVIRTKIQQKIARDSAISQIKSLIGFNGIIHHLKDYAITGNLNYLGKVNEKLTILNQIIKQFEHNYLINQEDIVAISAMKELSTLFSSATNGAQDMSIVPSMSPQLFNTEHVQQALEHLQRGQLDMSDSQWWQLTTKRLNAIIKINNGIQNQLVQNAKLLETKSIYALASSTLVIILTLGISFLFCYLILQRLVGEIGNIVRFMKQTKHHHEFNNKITLTGNDEITDMERAYNELLTERQEAEHLTRISAAVFQHASEAIFITNADNIIEEVNPAFTYITGYSAEDAVGKTPKMLTSGRHDKEFYQAMWHSITRTGSWQGEVWNRRKDGQIYPEYLAISAVKDNKGNIVQHIALFSDISKHKQYEQDIWYQANYDALTKLPNRNLLSNRLEHELGLMQRQEKKLAVLFIDLDRFKYINDTFGHSYGDELIISIAEKLSNCIRKSDTIARLGGDEFIVLLPNIAQLSDLERLATKILEEASTPVALSNGHQATVTASIGVSVYPNDANDAESLLKNADTAMYRAKELGKNRFCFYTNEMNNAMSQRMHLDMELRQAIINHEFLLHYQPILETEKNTISGVEALLRWQHPERGMIYPDEFIELAEDTGLIIEIGRQVLKQAATDLNLLHQLGYKIKMAVNISGRQCSSNSTPIEIELKNILSDFNISPAFFHIEITESLLIENTQKTKNTFQAIKDLGIDIYMDDFGTGYSSLSYLKQFPIDVLKIDRSFIWKMLENEADANLVKAIIMIGHNFQLKLVGEGVETKEHYDCLVSLGCDYVQGYYIARPVALEQLTTLLASSPLE